MCRVIEGRVGPTHDLSSENKALCSWPCEHACQRKAEGVPLSASPSQWKHKSSAGSLTERDSLINHNRCVLAAVCATERRPVKASLTVVIREVIKRRRLWLYFLTKETPDTSSLVVFSHWAHTNTHLDKLWSEWNSRSIIRHIPVRVFNGC